MLTPFAHALLNRKLLHPILASVSVGLRRLLLVGVLLLVVGCQAGGILPASLVGTPQGDSPLLSIDSVESAGQLGAYTLSGQARLPDQTVVVASATRAITTQPVEAGALSGQSQPDLQTAFYAILDRQQVVIENQQWTAALQLLQTDPGGGEQWQAEAATSPAPWQPQSEVAFTVTLEPGQQTNALREQLRRDEAGFETGVVRVSDDGELYAIATQTITVDPPQWTPPAQSQAVPVETRAVVPPQTPTAPTPDNAPPLQPEAYLR